MSSGKKKKKGWMGSIDESIASWADLHTLTRHLPDAGEVAGLIKFLTSDEAASITGQIFVIDSGWMISEARNYQNLGDREEDCRE